MKSFFFLQLLINCFFFYTKNYELMRNVLNILFIDNSMNYNKGSIHFMLTVIFVNKIRKTIKLTYLNNLNLLVTREGNK